MHCWLYLFRVMATHDLLRSARLTQNKGLGELFLKGEEAAFFAFSRQILQMFTGNCEPHRSKRFPRDSEFSGK
jgi:hypothetical protein